MGSVTGRTLVPSTFATMTAARFESGSTLRRNDSFVPSGENPGRLSHSGPATTV